jgi:hypothetical protein
MSHVTVFLLFLAKHYFLANIIDLGYSESRRDHHTLSQAWLYLTYQLLLEAFVTLMLLFAIILVDGAPLLMWRWETFLVLEAFGGVTSWISERKASYDNAISTHVLAELALLFLYTFLVYACYPF